MCCYEGRGGLCSVRLSFPLLKLRPRKDLVETLLVGDMYKLALCPVIDCMYCICLCIKLYRVKVYPSAVYFIFCFESTHQRQPFIEPLIYFVETLDIM